MYAQIEVCFAKTRSVKMYISINDTVITIIILMMMMMMMLTPCTDELVLV